LERQLEVRTRELAETRKALAEALEQQTATSEVLSVISSSPGELEPVFHTMLELEKAVRICEAKFGNLLLYQNESFRIVALHNAPHAYREPPGELEMTLRTSDVAVRLKKKRHERQIVLLTTTADR
jgi:hypothetical protein